MSQSSMTNKHLKVGAHPWPPLLDIRKSEGGTTVIGPIGDYLRFIMDARNCTYEIVTPSDGKWGNCNGADNCTGVIGLVARLEVDFAINPFTVTLDRKIAVDFTRPIQTSSYAVVIPVKSKLNTWFFINPFTSELWLLYTSSIPLNFAAMVLVCYLCHKIVKLETTASFVLRVALNEHSDVNMDLTKKIQQKILIIMLVSSYMVLTYCYSGTLTAMLTAPRLQSPIKSLNELLNQHEIPWVLESGSFLESLMSAAPSKSTTRKLLERSTPMSLSVASSGCYSTELEKSGEFGAICSNPDFKTLSAKHFSKTGKCHFYAIEERFLDTIVALAIPVRIFICYFP